jgi:hypothetical protein
MFVAALSDYDQLLAGSDNEVKRIFLFSSKKAKI